MLEYLPTYKVSHLRVVPSTGRVFEKWICEEKTQFGFAEVDNNFRIQDFAGSFTLNNLGKISIEISSKLTKNANQIFYKKTEKIYKSKKILDDFQNLILD